MLELLVQISDLPVEGRELSFTEQRIWTDPIAEFCLPYRLGALFEANLVLQPHQEGCLVSGAMHGSLIMPCARCAEELEYRMDVEFQEFGSFPVESSSEEESWWIKSGEGLFFLDAAGFLWEQFQLALPVKALCSPLCRGICTLCGANKNQVSCDCFAQAGDPRLSALRTM